MTEKNYGALYQRLRKDRGYTLKEAAGDTVTPQFLSRFEKGDSQIGVAKFHDILENIGCDYDDFSIKGYEEEPSEFYQMQLEVHRHVAMAQYGKVLEILDDYTKTHKADDYGHISHRVITKHGMSQFIGTSFLTKKDLAEKDYMIQRLTEIETWGKIEACVYTMLLTEFGDDFIIYKAKRIQEELNSNDRLHFSQMGQFYLVALRTSIDTLSKRGYYQEAERIAVDLLASLKASPQLNLYFWESLDICFHRACNRLRQNDPAGLDMAKQVFAILKNAGGLMPTPLIDVRRERFFKVITELNQTGIPFTP